MVDKFVDARPMPHRLLLLTIMLALQVRASDFLPPRLYDVTIETVMPHLEENLRYTTTHQKSCITLENLSAVFPILNHPALAGCTLGAEARQTDSVSYRLVCSGGHGTMGNALWQLGKDQIRGRLDVKLGGKNMTFSQSVTAKTLGPCPSQLDRSSAGATP
jgi:uncharacterized protein DUF3617